MTKKQLSPKEIAEQLEYWHFSLSKKDHAELFNETVVFINKQPLFFYYEKKLVPSLHYLAAHPVLKKIVVDMGAVRFVVSGADIMRPGIIEIESEISAGDFVVIVDVQHKKPLAVGIALFSSADTQQMTTGKVVKNIHYVGDWMWKGSR